MATLTAKERTDFTRSSLRNIRTSGHVPGIIYGKDTGNKPVSLDSVELIKTLRDEGKNAVITLEVSGEKHSVMVTDLQTDPLKNEITFALSSGYYDAYYKKAQKVRTLIKKDFEDVFEKYDVIVGPTTPTPAFKIGENTKDPLTMYANDILTIPVNLAGVPGISVPCGLADGLPLGLQIIGKHFDESTVYRVAHAFEQATDHHKAKPEL